MIVFPSLVSLTIAAALCYVSGVASTTTDGKTIFHPVVNGGASLPATGGPYLVTVRAPDRTQAVLLAVVQYDPIDRRELVDTRRTLSLAPGAAGVWTGEVGLEPGKVYRLTAIATGTRFTRRANTVSVNVSNN